MRKRLEVRAHCPVCRRISTDNIDPQRPGGRHHCDATKHCGLVVCACGATYDVNGRSFVSGDNKDRTEE